MNREYNPLDMCCRIACSSPYNRVVNGLLIFLATFLIGLSAAQTVSWLDRYPFTKPNISRSCPNQDGLSILRVFPRLDENRSPDPVLLISNQGIESIYYRVDRFGNVFDSPVDLDHRLASGDERLLEPGDRLVFSAAKYDQDPQTITLSYRKGDSKRIYLLTAYFSNRRSTPDRCNDY